MKKKEIQLMGIEEQELKLTELKKELMKSNAQIATGTAPKNSGQIRQIKKAIARILTNRREKGQS